MSAGVPFLKMSGAGNDFVVLDGAAARAVGDLPSWTRRVCRRGLSVGSDGVLVVEPEGAAVRVRFLNPDGGDAFCGNGTRCAARYAAMRGWGGPELTLLTSVGRVPAVVDRGRVSLRLPAPSDLGAWTDGEGRHPAGRRVLAGVPHLVLPVPDVRTAPLASWGPALRRHPDFGPEGTNVDVVSLDGPRVRIRTWERGVEGETLSCGSGAVAAGLWACRSGLGDDVEVVPASGIPLRVALGAGGTALLEGDARVVFEGRLGDEGVEGFGQP